jgi:hypothetical protein
VTVKPEDFAPEFREVYERLSPDGPSHWPVVLERIQRMWSVEPDYTLEQMASVKASTLVIVGDPDLVSAEHSVEVFRAISDAASVAGPIDRSRPRCSRYRNSDSVNARCTCAALGTLRVSRSLGWSREFPFAAGLTSSPARTRLFRLPPTDARCASGDLGLSRWSCPLARLVAREECSGRPRGPARGRDRKHVGHDDRDHHPDE